jgi:hypothetical protein
MFKALKIQKMSSSDIFFVITDFVLYSVRKSKIIRYIVSLIVINGFSPSAFFTLVS